MQKKSRRQYRRNEEVILFRIINIGPFVLLDYTVLS